MIHRIASSEAHLDSHGKFCARQVEWFPPRPARWVSAIVPSLIGVVFLFCIVGAVMAAVSA